MNILIRITANFLIAIGVVVLISGILIIFRLGYLIASVPGLNSFVASLENAMSVVSIVAGGKVVLDGLIYMAVGEFLILFIDLVEHLRKIAEK